MDFKILDRNGKAPHPWERGPKDVAYIGEGETVRMIMKFGPHKGRYMIHCHNLVHEDHDMMAQFEVGAGGDDPIASAPARPTSEAPPLYTKPVDPPDPPEKPNVAPSVALLRPSPNGTTRSRRPTIVAKVTDDEPLDKDEIQLFLDGRRITNFGYNPETGALTYVCPVLKLGWHRVQILADDGSLKTPLTARFRVVLR